MTDLHRIELTVNGEARAGAVEPRRLLCDFLREDLGLTGTHVACEHGVCGTCTVLVDGRTVRSCLRFAIQVDGAEVVTVEGLSANGELHAVQRAFSEAHALQCGFCTPGFLMVAASFLESNPDPDEEDVRRALDDVLCRCTGYQNIVQAVLLARDHLAGSA